MGGGIVGEANNSLIRECFNFSNNAAAGSYYSYVGGIAGEIKSDTSIEDCFNGGEINSTASSPSCGA